MKMYSENPAAFKTVRAFYWELIGLMRDQVDVIGWKQGIYPSDDLLRESLERSELHTFRREGRIIASVILNSRSNEGYIGVPWRVTCADSEVLIPHALAVHPDLQGQGIGKALVREIIARAKAEGKRAVRLDILGGNTAAERLYTSAGFRFIQAKAMFYEDTGLTTYRLFELAL